MNETTHASTEVLRRSEGLLTAALGDELLMMSVDQGKYHNLNDVGTAIWNLLEQPQTIDDLVGALTTQFDVAAGVARPDVIEFVTALRERGLIEAG